MPTKLYKCHVANLREIELALTHVSRLARDVIASKNPEKSLVSLLRLYSFLIGARLETSMLKLLNEDSGFSKKEKEEIQKKENQLAQWSYTVETAFKKHYQVKNVKNLPATAKLRFDKIDETIKNELKILIEVRNKLAHGQWKYPLNNKGTAVEAKKYALLAKENLQSLTFKLSISKHIVDLISSLVLSRMAFERDFDEYYKKLIQTKTNLGRKDYNKYESNLIKKRAEGKRKQLLNNENNQRRDF